jgi:hypothetical protein
LTQYGAKFEFVQRDSYGIAPGPLDWPVIRATISRRIELQRNPGASASVQANQKEKYSEFLHD